MKGQKSILSFLQKPSPPGNQNPAGNLTTKQNLGGNQTAADSSSDIRGTDTPPEKVPRPIFPSKATADDEENAGRSLFDSIKHKFVKPKDSAKSSDRNVPPGGNGIIDLTSNKYINSYERNANNLALGNPVKEGVINVSGSAQQGHKRCPLPVESDDDVIGPETPGTRPLVPRLKRVLEDGVKFEDISDYSFLNNSKRVKFFEDSQAESKKPEVLSETTISRTVKIFQDSPAVERKHEVPFEMPCAKRGKCIQDSQPENIKHEVPSDMVSKFEWLDPAKIRDANRKRPDDPLYNARTLYIPPDALRKMSASQKQYWAAKSQYMDVVLFFKVGKFYELYELDAEIGHKELDWKMTMSGVGKCRQVGISESGIDDAVQKLLARGYKVGRMEQLETSEQAKSRGHASVIERKLVNVLTPSTLTGGNIGPHAVHLLALKEGESGLDVGPTAYGFAFVDCAALKFWVGSFSDDASCAALGALLMQVSPKEIIYESHGLSKEAQKALKKYSLAGSVAAQLSPAQPATDFVDSSEVQNVFQSKGYFKGSSNIWDHALHGIMHQDLALCALGGLASHLSRLMLDDALRNGDILPYEVYSGSLRMDGQTIVNLEIFNNNADGGTAGTLYNYLDNCITPSGKRLLRKWICHPLKDVEQINRRLNLVEEFMAHSEIMVLVAQYLKKLPDLERFLGQIKATIQASSLILLPLIGSKILKQRVKVFGCLIKGLRSGIDLLMLLQKEGNIVSALSKIVTLPILGGNDGLDKFLAQFEAAIESDFPNYQDHDLKDSDAEILSILIDLFIEKATDWCEVILALNCIDVLRSFAATAAFSCGTMSRPIILPQSQSSGLSQESKGPTLKIKGLWHPFALGENGGLPVPNDLYLGEDGVDYNPRTLLLTGPNMGGKSTLLRATCLAIILAQLGCYVPCESCTLSLVDIIFTRLGATDRIMTGESTFFIECTETASILQNASQDSLVLLDELGRGTSTFDGYAIAYAVFRHLVEKVNCRLLFATHYHPLTKEFAAHPHVTLKHMACAFKPKSENSSMEDQELVFLYRLSSGACPESYGMQVALMAGIPKHVVEAAYRAGELMKRRIGESFRSSEQRSEFSTLHEDWLRTLLAVSKAEERISDNDDENDDVFDTLYCVWHELKSSKQRLSKWM